MTAGVPSIKPESGKAVSVSSLSMSLRAIVETMRAKVRSGENDMFGVLAFGPGRAGRLREDSTHRWAGVRRIIPLAEVTLEAMNVLNRIVNRLEAGHTRLMEAGGADVKKGEENFSFGEDVAVNMEEVLWAVRHEFAMVKAGRNKNTYNRNRAYVFTNDDCPTGSALEGGVKKSVMQQARDLSEAGVTLDVSFIRTSADPPEKRFNPDLFYKHVVYVDSDEWTTARGAINDVGFEDLEALQDIVIRKHARKRCTARTSIVMGPGVEFAVGLYSLVRKRAVPRGIKVESQTSAKVATLTKQYSSYIGAEITPQTELRTWYGNVPFLKSNLARHDKSSADEVEAENGEGGEAGDGGDESDSESDSEDENGRRKRLPTIYGLSPAEVKAIGQLSDCESGMVLYGFRDISWFRPEMVTKPCSFVYPDESRCGGSGKIFASLLESMLKMNKLAILCRSSARTVTGPRFVALVPQGEELSEDGLQIAPPGMHLFPLPFKDDIRTAWRGELTKLAEEVGLATGAVKGEDVEMKEEDLEVKSEDVEVGETSESAAVMVMSNIVKRLRSRKFSVEQYSHPGLSRYFAAMECEAGFEDRFDPEDHLEPDLERIHERTCVKAGDEDVDLIEQFSKLTCPDDYDAVEIAKRYGTATSLRDFEKAKRDLKRKAELDAKQEAALDLIDKAAVEDAVKAGTLKSSYTVAKLKEICLAFGLKATGNKPILVERVEVC